MYAFLKQLSRPFGSLLALLILIAGCDAIETNNTEPRQLKITMSAEGNSISLHKSQTTTWDTNTVELSEVKLLFHELELKTIMDDSLDFEIYDLIVNLPLDGDTLELVSNQIPSGDYNKIDIEIDKNNVNDPDLNDSTGYYSIVAKGTYNEEEFTFRTNREFKETFKFNPPITISDTTSSVTLHISLNVDRWFKYADPTNPEHQYKIERNIEKSLKARCWYRGGNPWWGDDDDDDDDHKWNDDD